MLTFWVIKQETETFCFVDCSFMNKCFWRVQFTVIAWVRTMLIILQTDQSATQPIFPCVISTDGRRIVALHCLNCVTHVLCWQQAGATCQHNLISQMKKNENIIRLSFACHIYCRYAWKDVLHWTNVHLELFVLYSHQRACVIKNAYGPALKYSQTDPLSNEMSNTSTE